MKSYFLFGDTISEGFWREDRCLFSHYYMLISWILHVAEVTPQHLGSLAYPLWSVFQLLSQHPGKSTELQTYSYSHSFQDHLKSDWGRLAYSLTICFSNNFWNSLVCRVGSHPTALKIQILDINIRKYIYTRQHTLFPFLR